MTYHLVRVEGTCPACGLDDGVLYLYILYEPSFILLYIYIHQPIIADGQVGSSNKVGFVVEGYEKKVTN